MNINLLPITSKNLFNVTLIEDHLFDVNERYDLETFKSILIDYPNNIFFIKLDNIVGILISYVLDEYYYLDSIGILPEFRNKGMCKQLFNDYLIPEAKRLSCDEIRLHVNKDNTAAIGLYMKLGFETIEVIENYYGDNRNGYYMKKKI